MDYGTGVNTRQADKVLDKLPLAPGEAGVFVGKCSNWAPIAADLVVVTNERIIATPLIGAKAVWEARHGDITRAECDESKRSLTFATADGDSLTFKRVPSEDLARIISAVNDNRSMRLPAQPAETQPPVADLAHTGPSPTPQKKEGRFVAAVKRAAADVSASLEAQRAKTEEAYASGMEAAGRLMLKEDFAGYTVEVYERGYVRVGLGAPLPKSARFERLQSVTYTQQVQDKSSGGRALAGLATGGLNYLASNEKRIMFLTLATDLKVHTLKGSGDMFRLEDKSGLALEAACKGVLDTMRAESMRAGTTTHVPGDAVPSIPEQVRQLSDLHRDGVLSDEEFAAAKARLLGIQ